MTLGETCDHGQLKRSCLTCELLGRIAELERAGDAMASDITVPFTGAMQAWRALRSGEGSSVDEADEWVKKWTRPSVNRSSFPKVVGCAACARTEDALGGPVFGPCDRHFSEILAAGPIGDTGVGNITPQGAEPSLQFWPQEVYDTVVNLQREAKTHGCIDPCVSCVASAIRAAVEAERAACAHLALTRSVDAGIGAVAACDQVGRIIAAAIRARGAGK